MYVHEIIAKDNTLLYLKSSLNVDFDFNLFAFQYFSRDSINDVFDILDNLSRVERFKVILMFLGEEDKRGKHGKFIKLKFFFLFF